MKPLVMLLLIYICTAADTSELLLLPDEASDALHLIGKKISSARESVVIVTPELQSPALYESIVKLFDNKIDITIITAPSAPGESAKLSQYSKVNVLTHRGLHSDRHEGTLRFSVLLIDSQHLCTSALAFSVEAMKHHVATLECSSDAKRLTAYRGYIKTLTARAKPYLE